MKFNLFAACALASPAAATLSRSFYAGHDLSSLPMLENADVAPAIFKDTLQNDTIRPAEDILVDGGMNSVRLRYASLLS